MRYYFMTENLGPCRIELNASGKYGFSQPKIFVITYDRLSKTSRCEFHYKNRDVHGIMHRELSNAQLCRVAITQFVIFASEESFEGAHELDPTFPLFDGLITNEEGVALSPSGRLFAPPSTKCSSSCSDLNG